MLINITLKNLSILKNSFINVEKIEEELINNPFVVIIVYILNQIPVAYLNYSEIYDRIEINQIEVQKDHRNKKIGSLLLENLIKKEKDITLEVKENNYIAISLYEKYGFKKVAIRKGYYKDKDGILMERKCVRK